MAGFAKKNPADRVNPRDGGRRSKPMPGRSRPGDPGDRALARWTDSTAAQAPSERYASRGTTRRANIPVPEASRFWLPQARSWFNSLRLSGQAEFYEASDWATAVICATLLDSFLRTRSLPVFKEFRLLSARLGITIADRHAARILLDEPEPEEPRDEDEEAADATILDWHRKFKLVGDDDEDNSGEEE